MILVSKRHFRVLTVFLNNFNVSRHVWWPLTALHHNDVAVVLVLPSGAAIKYHHAYTTVNLVSWMVLCNINITLTHWGRVTHICVSKLTIIGSDNGLSPGQRQAIIWTIAGILLIWTLGTNLREILIKTLTFSFKKMRLNVSSAKWRPFCLGLNELIQP